MKTVLLIGALDSVALREAKPNTLVYVNGGFDTIVSVSEDGSTVNLESGSVLPKSSLRMPCVSVSNEDGKRMYFFESSAIYWLKNNFAMFEFSKNGIPNVKFNTKNYTNKNGESIPKVSFILPILLNNNMKGKFNTEVTESIESGETAFKAVVKFLKKIGAKIEFYNKPEYIEPQPETESEDKEFNNEDYIPKQFQDEEYEKY